MLLPNADKCFIDLRKLTDYALSMDDARGQHKARVFNAALGITKDNAEVLKKLILKEVVKSEAIIGEEDFMVKDIL